MKYKVPIILVLIFSIFIILFSSTLIIIYPDIKLNGGDITLEYGDTYKELGAYTTRLKNKLKINITNNINYDKLGKYKVIYTYKIGPLKKEKIRHVSIVDTKEPTIELVGDNEVTICPNKEYQEAGFKALDNYDGDITEKVIKENIDNKINYIAVDSSGNKTVVSRTYNKSDTKAPTITLKNSNTIYLFIGNSYKEYGYTVKDNCDDNLDSKVKVTNNVNTSKTGTYYVTYTVTDSSNNKTTVKRKVVVIKKNNDNTGTTQNGVIYLTFDDGPSNYTDYILDILKKYNVKATFFVTSNGSNSTIKRAYDEGHTIGLHTYTHDYSKVYSSIDNYFNDLEKISNRVYNIIGIKSNIIRFPGGSSNTVSANYTKGIMSYLSSEVINRGYRYYDWNISSGDAGGTSSADGVYNNVTKALSKSKANMVLMHDTKLHTRNAIERIIQYGLEKGYVFKPITSDTKMVQHHINN